MTPLERIQKVMREVFDDSELIIEATSSPDDIADWDSFANIQLVAALEQEFNIRLTTAQATTIRSVADLLSVFGK